MTSLVRHGPFPDEDAARAFMNADPRPQDWLAANGAYIVTKFGETDWWAWLPDSGIVPPGDPK